MKSKRIDPAFQKNQVQREEIMGASKHMKI